MTQSPLRPPERIGPLIALAVTLVLGFTATPAHATHCDSCATAVDTCCSRMPRIQDAVYTAPVRGVIETREPDLQTPFPYCVTLYDVTQNIPAENVNWNPISRYHGPFNSWNATNLGTVFGLTVDRHGNIYVTHAACYNSDLTAAGGPGAIYRIDGTNGTISTFATLPNAPDANYPPGSNLPGLGNISYDCDHDQFFVTNMEDGRVYRIKSFNPSNASPATVLNFFDPGAPDNGVPGWAPLNDRLWAVQWHGNRVYYSVWGTDIASPPGSNVIRSIALDGSGDFVWFSDQLEIVVPSHPNMAGRSSPVSDMSFGPTGKLLLAERTMYGPTTPSAHQARVLEYFCEPVPGGGPWIPSSSTFNVGQIGTQENAAGGVDYDFSLYNGPSPPATAPPGLGGSQGRVWATGDAIHFGSPHPDVIYGLQAFRPTGGTIANSLLIDSDGNFATADKTFIGDVEVPCPPPPSGRICGQKFRDDDHDGVKDVGEPTLSGWTIQLAGPVSGTVVTDAAGNYCFTGLPAGTYTVTEVNQPGWIQSAPPGGSHTVTLPPDALGIDFGNYPCVAPNCVQPPIRMSSWWPLDEPSGPMANDIVGPNNAAWVGSPVAIAGMVGGALRFPTAADYVAAAPHASLNFGVGNLSIDCWVRSSDTSTGVRVFVDHRTGTATNPTGYSLFMFNNRLGFQLGDGGPTTNWVAPAASPNLSDGAWHHVAVTVVRGSTIGGTLYVDGNPWLTFDPTVRPGNTDVTAPLWIGQRMVSGTVTLNGDIDEVELFRRALAAAEVQALFNAGSAGKCKTTCWLPSVRTYSPNQTAMTVCFNICNDDWTQPSQTFAWTMAGLPTGPGCTIAGPIAFSPSSGTVTVPAGACVPVCVTIQRPAGLVPGQTACYQLSATNLATGFCCTSTGRLRASKKWHYLDKVADIVAIPDGGATVTFPLRNDGVAGDFSGRITEAPHDADPTYRVLSLNGLPPGEPILHTISVDPNESFDVSVSVSYAELVSIPIREVIIEADLDGDGIIEESCAIGVRHQSSGTISAPEPPAAEGLDEVIGIPNPFETTTGIRFTLPRGQRATVRVFDVNGRMLRTLHQGSLAAGRQHVTWDGLDGQGKRAGAGIYFIRVETAERTINAKVVRMR